ncbi:MAG: choice-of-anchor D domain-containing protein [Terracidiphilus sp.]
MDLNGASGIERKSKGLRRAAAIGLLRIGLLLYLPACCAYAQNAAQRAALAKLGTPRANVLLSNNQFNGVEATGVSLDRPVGVAYDAAGNLYIADTDNFVIREVNLAGITTVVAGTGEQGCGGDGGPATSALLDSPEGIALDSAGNLYIADSGNHRIREVTGGVITTIAGTGTCGYSGDGEPATAAALCLPTAVAVDSAGGIYIADTNNYRIRKIAGTTISTVAGNGVQSFSGDGGQATAAGIDSPFGVAVDSAFNIYIADTYNQRVRMVAYATGVISTIAGTGVKNFTSDGVASTAALALPTGIAVDSFGTVYVADSDNNRIRAIASGQIATIAGTGEEGFSGDTGSPTNAELDTPQAVALLGNSLTVADTENQAVRIVTGNGIDTTAGSSSNSTETLGITGITSTAYGTGTVTATFSNGSKIATGSIAFYDGLGGSPTLLNSTALTANQATLNTSTLNAGMHYLTASYGGDQNNGELVSGVYVLNVTPLAITAAANGVNLSYGQNIPTLTGTLSGVLAQDAEKVAAVYTTAANSGSAPGSYPISVALSGASAGDYTVTLGAGSGTVTIAKAATQITLAPSASTVAYGATVTLTATVASTTTGTPTGSVLFYDGSTQLNSAGVTLSGGLATLTLNTLSIGAQSLTAVYSGDSNFVASTSIAQSVTVSAPSLSTNLTGLDFGSQPAGTTSAAQTLILSNPYGLPVTVTGITASGDYAAASDCPVIAANKSCSVNVTFAPSTSGVRSASLTAAIAQSSSVLTLPLTGIGTAPGLQVTPSVVNFGSQVVSTASSGQTITIQNTGSADLTISNIAATGDFTVTGSCTRVPAGSNCSLTAAFNPTALGSRTGTVTFTDNVSGGNQTQVVNLSGIGTQAGATLSPSVLTLSDTLVGSTSFVLNATLTNSGTAQLNGITVSALGDYSQTNNCTATLAPGASCTIGVTFMPTVAGADAGTLSVSDSLGAQTVALNGSGLVPGASLSTAQLVFGGQLVNTSSRAQTVIFTNTGSGALTINSVTPTANFTDTTNCLETVAAGTSCSINVIFTPAATGAQNGSVTVTDSAGAQVFTAQGQGISPGLAMSPTFTIFGAQMVNTSSPAQTIVLKNTGTMALTLNPITVSSNFIESDQCPAILQPNATCSISVVFAPNSTGPIYGSLVVSDTSGLVETLLAVSGQGTLPGISTTPSTLSFGSLPVATPSDAQTVTVWNTGTAPLQIGVVSGTGDFTETDNCASKTVPANGYCVINVTMTPSTMGTRTGAIQFYDNADGLHMIALSGMGQQAGVSVAPTRLAFGSLPATTAQLAAQTAGTSLSVTVTNTGNLPLQLGGFAMQGDFTESDSCGSTIPLGSACTLTVTFVPTAVGHRTGTLTLTDNAGGGTQMVSLEGDGSPSGLLLTPSVLNFGIQTNGFTSAPLRATLTNDTGETLSNLAITASGEYNETDNCGGTLANGANCTLNITITPATTGAITGTIDVSAGTSNGTSSSLRHIAQGAAAKLESASTGISGSDLGVIALTATSIPPGIGLSIPSLSFSVTSAATSGTVQTVTLTNTGSSAALTHLTINETNVAEFPFSTACPSTLAAQASCTITVNFTPTSVGLRAGIMHISADGGISAALTESGTVSKIAPTVLAVSGCANAMLQDGVTFTATVSSSLGVPTGTVAFMDGANLLGVSNLSAGTATFTTFSLAVGSHFITAVYNGDTNFVGITSAAVSESILDFALSAKSASSSGGTTQQVVPGSPATFSVSITPTTGTAFPAAAILSVSGLPAGATATLNSAAWTRLSATSWQLPANTQLSDVALSFVVPAQTAKANGSPHRKVPPVLWEAFLLPFAIRLRRAGKRIASIASLLLILIAGAAAITGLSGCNSGNGFFAQTPQSDSLTITVTTGALAHSTNITLNVE